MIQTGRTLFKLLSYPSKAVNNAYGGSKMMYTFATFPSNQQMRFQKLMGFNGFEPNQAFIDDLHFPLNNEIQYQAVDDLIHHIKSHPNLTIEIRGLCTILYLIAKLGKHEPFIFKELERHLYKFKENISGRLAYGGLYASYKSNLASAYQISFFEDEFNRTQNSISAFEAIEVLQTMSINTTKSNQHKIDYFHQSVKPIILVKFDKGARPYVQNLYNLFTGLRDMQIYDEQLFELILKYLPYRRGLSDVHKFADVYETLCEFKEKGLLKQNLDAHIQRCEKKLQERHDFRWRYNLKEKRMYTYDELVANRDKYDIKNQLVHKYRHSHPEFIEKFNLVQSDKDAIKAELEARERTRELENLVLEMFELKNRGEVKQTEDKSTLQGRYENVIFVKEGEELEDDENAEVDDEPFEDVDDGQDISLKSDIKPKIKNQDKGNKGKKNKQNKTE